MRVCDLPARHPRGFEAAAITAILLIAVWLRFADLATMPPGLHGDEAVSGIDARRILNDGWIGVYSPLALGQPTGPLYLTALSLRLFGESIVALRVVSAALGVLTVAALYLMLRRNVGASTALVSAALLAVMGWHLHFSRIAFPVAAWPLFVVMTAAVALEAARTKTPGWWGASGVVAGLGMYVYNAHPVVLVCVVLFAAVMLVRRDGGAGSALDLRARLLNGGAFALGLALALLPMGQFAADERNGFFQHHRAILLVNQPPWTAVTTWTGRAAILAGRYRDFWDQVCCHPVADGVDGTGLTPLVPPVLLALAAVGLLCSLRRWREPWVVFSLFVALFVPLAAVITVDGLARRTLALTPIVALFAGYGMIALMRSAAPWRSAPRYLVIGALMALTAAVVSQNLDHERGVFARSQEAAWIFAAPMVDAARFMACLRPRHHVYFFSDRWSVDYESRRFLAPNVSAEDRSAEFGEFDLRRDPEDRHPVYILLGAYRDELVDVRRRYPRGETFRLRRAGSADDPSFVAYFPSARGTPNFIPPRCRDLKQGP